MTLSAAGLIGSPVALKELTYEDEMIDYNDFNAYNVSRYVLTGELFLGNLTNYSVVNGTDDPYEFNIDINMTVEIQG